MKLLKEIPTRHFISIDIETVRITENYDDLSPEWKSAWEYKNKQDGEVPRFEELSGSWEKSASLYAEFSKVCAVSLAFLSKGGDKIMVKEFYGDNELEILEGLSEFFLKISSSIDGKNYRLLGHASKYFDYPYLCKRYVINGLDIPQVLDSVGLKPWEQRNLCTNSDIWKMGGTGPGSSLQALCTALGIPVSKVDLVGDEVGKAYYRGEYGRIARYCSLDTVATFNIITKIKREHVFNFDEIIYIEDVNPVTKKELEAPVEDLFTKAHILERLNNSPQISEAEKEELTKLLKKKKILKKDLPILREILIKLYINSAMFQNDKGDVVERKNLEIDEILSNLQK